MFSFPNYRVHKLIHESDRSLVYQGVCQRSAQPVIFKILRNPHPTIEELAEFDRQYAIAQKLNDPRIVKHYRLENHRNKCILILEDFGGISLRDYLSRQKNSAGLSIPEFLAIALQITDILEVLIRKRVIHRDIKPDNILIHPKTKQIKLIDFSLASLLPKQQHILQNLANLEGTLPYLSPEQTGRMNRTIDYRTDFYALGVTFYELLLGQLPFHANEPIEWVHCHLAQHPIPPCEVNPTIPYVLSEIILKLMAKNAEDRYQSAEGLKHDLERCLHRWKDVGSVLPFELGQRDICHQFLIPEKLYGREEEIKMLIDAYTRVVVNSWYTSIDLCSEYDIIPDEIPDLIAELTGNNCKMMSVLRSNRSKPATQSSQIEVVLVAGPCGIGKTALINELHKPIVRDRGYFIRGKFDRLQQDIPFTGIAQAFRHLIEQILTENQESLDRWKAALLKAVGDNGQTIVEAIPEIEWLIGKQPPLAQVDSTSAQNRFERTFRKFFQVFTRSDRPLVVFLDDLQWADSASLKLIQLLVDPSEVISENITSDIKETRSTSLLLVGTYRDNEVSPTHPFWLTLESIKQTEILVTTIALKSLSASHVEDLVVDTLRCDRDIAVPLAQTIARNTQGNPFFTAQFLKMLHDEDFISFDFDASRWDWDLTRIQTAALTDNVVELVTHQLLKLTPKTQSLLQLAACIGNEFNLSTLATIAERSPAETAEILWEALQAESIFLRSGGVYCDREELSDRQQKITYQFLHDRVQQAAYELIPNELRREKHLQIGQLLLRQLSAEELDSQIFEVVNQLNLGMALITDLGDREELARLNLSAGRKAQASLSYQAAISYLTAGIQLLTLDSWTCDYDLTLALYESAVRTTYLLGRYEQMEDLAAVVLKCSRSELDRVAVYETQILAYGAQNRAREAVQLALKVLQPLGVEFPENPTQNDIGQALAETFSNLGDQEIEGLIDLPEMSDRHTIAVMRLLSSIMTFTYQTAPTLLPLIVLKQVNLSLEFGNSSVSAFAYSVFGFLLCGIVGDIDRGYQFGHLAVRISESFKHFCSSAKVNLTISSHIISWKEHSKEVIDRILQSYAKNLEVGDLEFASYALEQYSYFSFLLGKNLANLEEEVNQYVDKIFHLQHAPVAYWNKILHQSILNLIQPQNAPYDLVGEAYNEQEMLSLHLQANDGVALLYFYSSKLHLSYLFKNFTRSIEYADQAEQYLESGIGKAITPLYFFYNSLARLAIYSEAPKYEQKTLLEKVKANQDKMQHWSHHAPMNYLHKFNLVEAELSRVLGNKLEAIELYDLAIAGAQEQGYIQEEALANELAAQFYLEWGRDSIAQVYVHAAYYAYQRWGATAKLNDMEQRYPQFLYSISGQSHPHETLSHHRSHRPRSSFHTNHTKTSNHTSAALDLVTVLKASQALSSEIQLHKLISKLLQIVIENAGAESGALILRSGDSLTIEAKANKNDQGQLSVTCMESVSVELERGVPASVINYVWRTGQTLTLDDATAQANWAVDPYIEEFQPKSILCTTICNQGKAIGILYLENNILAGAFTSDRLEVLQPIATQAAISLENAMLYQDLAIANERLEQHNQTLEEKVAERTQELQENNAQLNQALTELMQTQTQLIQAEKMSSLGQMVAGVAHEINNPVSFITGNLSHVREYANDLLQLVECYQQEYPSPTSAIENLTEAIDFEFIKDDLPKLFGSMQVGCDRIRKIVLGLRNFSRLDEADMKPVDLHEGIENSLMILQHRLTAKGDMGMPDIEIVKDYGDLPDVMCYAAQINQVVVNLLSNAIDAVESRFSEDKASRSSASNGGTQIPEKGKICIRTMINSGYVAIRISDNGIGIPEEVKHKLFDPFFTTKPVGKGTGLGLSISYQIVVEQHQGQLSCHSIPGEGTEFEVQIPISSS
jgi:predicted ATPase/signal transduction histidine kinase